MAQEEQEAEFVNNLEQRIRTNRISCNLSTTNIQENSISDNNSMIMGKSTNHYRDSMISDVILPEALTMRPQMNLSIDLLF